MSLTPPLRTPGAVGLLCRRPGDPETGVYIARVYHGSETSVEARVYHGEGDAIVDFVLSLNMVRRHLSINQKLAAAHKAIPMYREQAKQRRLATLKRGEEMPVSANWREREEGKAAHHVANLFGVSPRAVERAEAVYRDGAPELVQAFESDEVSVSAAAEVATLPDDEQREVVAAGPDAMKNAAKAVRERKRPHVANNSGNMEWYTPPEIIERARLVMGVIDCDPASTAQANEIIRADCFYTIEDDGLTKPWNGCVWLNPPYGQPEIAQFAEAVVAKNAAREFDQACVLVNNATETNWFQSMLRDCTAVCFLKGRVKFIDCDGNATGAPLQGQALLYFGDDASVLKEHFGDLGVVMS